MTGGAFRDAIAAALTESLFAGLEPADPRHRNGLTIEQDDANAVLDTPEMQAIRLALHDLGVRAAAGADVRWQLIWNELPESVKEWVR